MRKSRQPRCIAAISGTVAFKTSKLLDADWNFSQAVFRARAAAGRDTALDGRKLSKACPPLKPFKQAAHRLRCLIFHLELFDVSGLGFGGFDPFLHLREPHDQAGVFL